MANSTINGLTEKTTPTSSDIFVIWDAAASSTKKVKGENLDKVVFRDRTSASTAASKELMLLSYSGGVPTIENITFENFNSNLVIGNSIITSGTITADKLEAGIRENVWIEKTSNWSTQTRDRINADTSAGAFTITLPTAPQVFDWVIISDFNGTWDTNNLTIARGSTAHKINGLLENLVCNVSAELLLRYEGATTGWRVFAYGY